MKKLIVLSIVLLGCASPVAQKAPLQEPKQKLPAVRDTTALREVFTNGGYYIPTHKKKKTK